MMRADEGIIPSLLRSRSGRIGIIMLGILVAISVSVLAVTPIETLREWNDPVVWLDRPKSAVPAWVNVFPLDGRIAEHVILYGEPADSVLSGDVHRTWQGFAAEYDYDHFPSDVIYEYEASYTKAPLLNIHVKRPDGVTVMLYSNALPYSEKTTPYSERVFSTDPLARSNLQMLSGLFEFPIHDKPVESVIFSKVQKYEPLHGTYYITAELYGIEPARIVSSSLILGGGAYGLLGTDDLRRDLAIGIAWGTPLALFIGVTVAIGSVCMGLAYGVYAGYRGRYTDEAMMRLNDVVYALPVLPFLIILAVTISNSIFVMTLFLMAFGWVGVAKVARSMALQIKSRSYVEASRMMGRRDSGVMIRHIFPQLLPYALASIAISVPAAITTEAGLSFLGLGDPAFPTWGQILHDAGAHGAAARGMWWWIIPPGLMVAVAGLAFVFIGNALDRVANPRMR